MSIFNVLIDCEQDTPLNIERNISSEKINTVFHIVNNGHYEKINLDDIFSNHLEIITFMKYLGVRNNIMEATISRVTNGSIIDYIDKCKAVTYDDNMIYIFDNYYFWRFTKNDDEYNFANIFATFVNKIIDPYFSIEFQKKIIKKMILTSCPIQKEFKARMAGKITKHLCDYLGCHMNANVIIIKTLKYVRDTGKKNDDIIDDMMFESIVEYVAESIVDHNKK